MDILFVASSWIHYDIFLLFYIEFQMWLCQQKKERWNLKYQMIHMTVRGWMFLQFL